MNVGLKELLTATQTEDGAVLFATAAALGEAVVAQESSDYTNARSVGTLISFMFRGKRSCPASLRTEILKATRARLSKQSRAIQDDWVQRVGRAIDAFGAELVSLQQSQAPSDEEQFGELIARARASNEQFIITPLSAEEDDEMRHSGQLNQLLMELLGIFPPLTSTPETAYCFLLPSERKARVFWRKLREKAEAACSKTGADASKVSDRLSHLDKLDKLSLYVVPPYVCGCPIVVFDPAGRFSTAFSFGYHAKNVIDAIQWDAAAIMEWKTNVYGPFQRTKEGVTVAEESLPYARRYTYAKSQQN